MMHSNCRLLLFVNVILLSIFELQGFNQKQNKKKKNWGFAVCLHTAKEPKVLCRVLAHGKGGTRRQAVCCWAVIWLLV
jgi:hypothetical protein